MPQFVSEGTERLLENPSEDVNAELVVHFDRNQVDEAKEWITSNGGSIIEHLGHGLLEIRLPESNICDLVETTNIDSIERTNECIEVSK